LPQAFQKDFSNSMGRRRKPARKRFRVPRSWLMVGLLVVGGMMLLVAGPAARVVNATSSLPHEEWLAPDIPAMIQQQWREQTIRPGDNIIAALERLGVSTSEAYRIVQAAKPVYSLRNIRAGHTLRLVQRRGQTDLFYEIDREQRLHLYRRAAGWQAKIDPRDTHSRRLLAAGVIHDSLFESAARAGLDSRTTMNLVDIFSWDIDFARDMRDGDSFRVLYDEIYDDEGNLIGTKILAAEFTNRGTTFRAVLFKGSNGREEYFTPSGKSMRKAYLKAPVKFTRISSRFRLRRKHPILGFTRAHRGVDYAAPMGTPVHAIGDGWVRFVGWKGGYGRFVLIRHLNRAHATAYAHLSRFARGLHRGMRVRQGQVIGYVGMSGLATGPHLHFEFRVRGRAIDPLTVKSIPSRPVPSTDMAAFKRQSARLLSALADAPTRMLAWE